jgi:hypothetical protein
MLEELQNELVLKKLLIQQIEGAIMDHHNHGQQYHQSEEVISQQQD